VTLLDAGAAVDAADKVTTLFSRSPPRSLHSALSSMYMVSCQAEGGLHLNSCCGPAAEPLPAHLPYLDLHTPPATLLQQRSALDGAADAGAKLMTSLYLKRCRHTLCVCCSVLLQFVFRVEAYTSCCCRMA
jgi:hypothetical protein